MGSPLPRGIRTAPGVPLSSAPLPLTPAAAFTPYPGPPGTLAQQILIMLVLSSFSKLGETQCQVAAKPGWQWD